MQRSAPQTLAIVGAIAIGSAVATWALFGRDPEPAPPPAPATEPATPAPPTEPTPRVAVPEGAAKAIADLERQREFHALRVAQDRAWLDAARMADLSLRLARLTGRFEHYGDAEAAIAQAFELAPEGSGPHVAAAQVDFTLHRFDDAEAHLADAERGVVLSDLAATLREMRADIALARGRYDEARAAYEAMAAARASTTNLTRLAHLYAQTGDLVLADRTFARAIGAAQQDRPFHEAKLELQRGLLDLELGRHAEARAHYERANAAFPGWYLVEEHLAETLVALGETERAEAIYADVVARTQSPELMGAHAEVLEALGRPDEAAALRARADARWEALLSRFPQALGGHGLEHFLERGPPDRALSLARDNAALRPDGEARVLLARALLGAGQAAEAARTIDALLETPYRTPSLHEHAAEIFDAAGRAGDAEAQRRAREALIAPFIAPAAAATVEDPPEAAP